LPRTAPAEAGLTLLDNDGKTVIDDVAFNSAAQSAGLDWDQEVLSVQQPQSTPTKYLMFIPALLLLWLIVWLQKGRAASAAPPANREVAA
jgi:hypothetical protein